MTPRYELQQMVRYGWQSAQIRGRCFADTWQYDLLVGRDIKPNVPEGDIDPICAVEAENE